MATAVRVLENVVLGPQGPIVDEELARTVSDWVLSAPESRNDVPIREPADNLRDTFLFDGSLLVRLGAKNLATLLRSIEGISVGGIAPNLTARKSKQREIGRISARAPLGSAHTTKTTAASSDRSSVSMQSTISPTEALLSGEPSVRPDLADIAAVRRYAIQVVSEASSKGNPMQLTLLGHELVKRFPGPRKLSLRLGYKTLTDFIAGIPDLEMVGVHPKLVVRPKEIGSAHSAKMVGSEDGELGNKRKIVVAGGVGPKRTLKADLEDELEREFFNSRTFVTQPSGTAALPTFEHLRGTILRLVRDAEAAGKRLTTATLGTQLNKTFAGSEKIHKRLGYNSLVMFLTEIPEIMLEPNGSNPLLSIRSPGQHHQP